MAPAEAPTFTSLGLKALCQQLDQSAGFALLDLGPAIGRNIEFWARFSPSLYVADLRSRLPLPPQAAADPPQEPEWDGILELPSDARYDVILTWDLLNYLDAASIPSFVRYLSRFCKTGGVLFALIFDQAQIPERPALFKIVDEEHLVYDWPSSGTRTCPRHQPRDISRVMSEFQPSGSFRLRHGVVEYLFAYQGA